jgi:hypothetical protein
MVKAKFTKPVDREKSSNYKLIAQQFYDTMQDALIARRWNAVGLNGIHGCISLTDAILSKYKGIRSTDSNHIMAADLLGQVFQNEEGKKYKRRLEEILRLKNVVSYEGREFNQSEANKIALSVDRFFSWGLQKV